MPLNITITLGHVDQDKWYMEVTDTGIGISQEALSYIFDEFRQVDDKLTRVYGGIGLGLAITRKIVELLDGEVFVNSKPNEGSQFRVILPRIAQHRTGTGSLVSNVAIEKLKSHVRAG
jgi:signal transduction histidine kinase